MARARACLLLEGENIKKPLSLCLPTLDILQVCFYTVFFKDFSPQSKQLSCQLIPLKTVEKMSLGVKVLRRNSYFPCVHLGKALGSLTWVFCLYFFYFFKIFIK